MAKKKVTAKIVIAEDEDFLRDILVKRFAKEGYEVIAAINGQEAIEVVLREKPNCLVLDFAMPVKNGFEVMQELKQSGNLPLTIVVSNSGDIENTSKAFQLGAKMCVVKAKFDLDDLVREVNKFVAESVQPQTKSNGIIFGATILVVEDDEFIRDILVRALTVDKFNILVAEDGEKTLEMLASEEKLPSIILLDLVLPGMSGYEVLKRIKENDKTSGIPVIILSNLGQRSEIEEGLKLGAEKFLIKANFLPEQIIATVKETLKKYQ